MRGRRPKYVKSRPISRWDRQKLINSFYDRHPKSVLRSRSGMVEYRNDL